MATVLVIGGGGREHSMVHHLSKAREVSKVFCAPGNPGIAKEKKVECVKLDVKQHKNVLEFCSTNKVELVAIGPEAPLADGLSDTLVDAGVLVFGPSHAAAALEYDKALAKDFMFRHNIPTALFKHFMDKDEAVNFLKMSKWEGWAIKAAGLAGGKGVVVTSDKAEAIAAVDHLKDTFKGAASTLVIEQRLYGEEISAMCFSDGKNISMMPFAQDHKARYDGNEGPNTGGMGAACPYVVPEYVTDAVEKILFDTIAGMAEEGMPFKGVLYAGIMLCDEEPYVLEYNCRFGDPETQAVLQIMEDNLYAVMKACATGELKKLIPVQFDMEEFAVSFVLVSENYPGRVEKGHPITGLDVKGETDMYRVKVYHSGTAINSDGVLVTNGGRVLSVVTSGGLPDHVRVVALHNANKIQFQGSALRNDIGLQATKAMRIMVEEENEKNEKSSRLTYSDAGVNVAKGEEFVRQIRDRVAATHGLGVLEGIGGFGGLFDFKSLCMKEPILVSGTDGVGTKLMVAKAVGRHDTIGQDLVAMCVNDIICHGAAPLFFLDYIATGRLQVGTLDEVITGIAEACKTTGTALIGGETAEMPGLYRPGEYDLAGFAVGVVEQSDILPKKNKMWEEDIVLGVASSGLHSNGYSLVRKIIESHSIKYSSKCPFDMFRTIGEVLLTPTRLYSSLVSKIQSKILGLAHITGGGIIGNAARMVPDRVAVDVDITKWNIPEEFLWIASYGVSPEEMCKTFNMGLGLMIVLRKNHLEEVLELLKDEDAFVVGQLTKRAKGSPSVTIANLNSHFGGLVQKFKQDFKRPQQRRLKTAILISGRGSNMEAIVRSCEQHDSLAEVVLVLSNKPDARGLTWAAKRRIDTVCVNHRDYSVRSSFEAVVNQRLLDKGVELVCLAGFMRVLTEGFVSKWKGRLINIHPSILPAFKGKDAQKQAIEAKVKISGCTVHFVETEVDSGDIIAQASVPVLPADTVESLSCRIREAEHEIFPSAIQTVAASILKKD